MTTKNLRQQMIEDVQASASYGWPVCVEPGCGGDVIGAPLDHSQPDAPRTKWCERHYVAWDCGFDPGDPEWDVTPRYLIEENREEARAAELGVPGQLPLWSDGGTA